MAGIIEIAQPLCSAKYLLDMIIWLMRWLSCSRWYQPKHKTKVVMWNQQLLMTHSRNNSQFTVSESFYKIENWHWKTKNFNFVSIMVNSLSCENVILDGKLKEILYPRLKTIFEKKLTRCRKNNKCNSIAANMWKAKSWWP